MTTDRWRRTTLGRIANGGESLRTGPFGNQLHASDYVAEGVPVVMPRDFAGGSIRSDSVARVSEAKAAKLSRFRVRAGDVLLARRGEMGRCTRIDAAQDGWLCGTGVLRIRPNGLLDGKFLTYLLRSPETAAWLRDYAVGQTLLSLNVRTLAMLPLLLPPDPEQRRIVRILSAVDRTRQSSSAVIDQIRQVRDVLRRQVLTAGGGRWHRTVDGLDPGAWRQVPVGSLCTLSNGFRFEAAARSDRGLPIIRIQNLNGSRDFHYFDGVPSPDWTVAPGDLLFAWAGVKGSSFGPCLWPGPRGVLNQHIFRVQPREGIVKEWLFEALQLVTRTIEDKARGFKSDLQHVRKAEVMEQLVPVPPPEAQRWIASLSRALAGIEATEESFLRALDRLKTGLLQDLLSGRVSTVRGRGSPRAARLG